MTEKMTWKDEMDINKAKDECTIGLLNLELMGLITHDKDGNIMPTLLGKNYVMLSEGLKRKSENK